MDYFILKEEIKYQVNRVVKNKVLMSLFVLFFIISASATYLYIDYKNNGKNSFYSQISNQSISPQVISGNFDIDYKKIPYNIPYIELKFNKKIDAKSVNEKSFTISPKIDGKISVSWDTIRYTFDKPKLDIWTEIEVNATKDIKTRAWESIATYSSFLQIAEAPKVVKISPETKKWDDKTIVDNLNSHIYAFFNVPIVPLTNLDNGDMLPCLIDIEPKVEGTCTWTTTSMLEFTPTSPLNGSSLYKIKISNKDWLLYNLEKETTSYLETSDLNFSINEESYYETSYRFSPNSGLHISSNFPITSDELKKNIIMQRNNKNIAFSVEQIKWSDTNFLIKSGDFKYSSNYSITFKRNLKPKLGNLWFKNDKTFNLLTNSFINSTNAYQKKFSSTWAELYPIYTSSLIYSLANKNAYLDIYLDEDAWNLDKNIFNFTDTKWNKVNYDLAYSKNTDAINEKWEKITIEDKKHLILTIKWDLAMWAKYKLIVSKKANNALENNLTYEYSTPNQLKIISHKYVWYNKSCLYTNSYLSYNEENYIKDYSKNFSYSPNAKIFSIWEYEAWSADKDYFWGKSWEEQEAFSKLSLSEQNNKLNLSKLCPMAPAWQILYVINHRLNPNTTYKFETKKDAQDLYWNNIWNFLSKTFKTGNDIKEIDKYVYTTISKDVSVIPKTAPIVFKTQTVNLDNISFDICEMDKAWYLDYLSNSYNEWYIPLCTNQTRRSLAVKNKYWDLSYTKFDLETDILWVKSNSNFILIRWYGTAFWSKLENGKNFQNLFIRSDMQAYMEMGGWDPQTGSNRSLIFATDFSGNPILNLTTDAYTRNYPSWYNKINLPVKYDKAWVYITNVTNLNDAVIFLKSWDKEAVITSNSDQAGNYDFGYNWWIDSYTKDFLYLYTDRPLYKAGDKVYFKWLARLFSLTWYKKAPYKTGKLELIDENYKTIKSIDVKLDNNSNFAWEFDLSKDASIGKYSFRFTVNGREIINNASFDIQEYVKPVFKVNLSQDKKDFTLWEGTKIKVNPEYYFGGKVISTKWTYSVLSQNYFFDAKDYGDYQFGEWNNYFDCLYWGYCSYNDNLNKVQEFNVDENWNYDLNWKFSSDAKDGEKLYTITAEVEDPDTKKVVSNSVTNILHNTDAYMWISIPWYSSKKDGIDFKWVVVDYNAKALENKDVKVELYKREWKSVLKQWVDGNFYNDYAYDDKLEDSFNLESGNDGKISKKISTKSDWQYFIKAIYTGENGKSFISSRDVYVSGENYVEWNNWNNDITDIVWDKTLVKIGETNTYTLKSPINSGKALIMIEKDDWVIDYFVHNISSYADRISIPVKDAYYPNFYLKAFLIGTPANSALPVYKRALTSTKVVVNSKKINVGISPNKTSYLPGDKLELTIKVTDENWRWIANANWSIAVVDESLLALMWNPKKNPFAFFYEMKRYLGTLTYISLKNLVEKLEVKDIRDGEKWWAWDQMKWWDSNKKRWIFKDTAYFKADFTTDSNWIFKITTDALPDNLTTWDIESIVTSPDNKIWIGWAYVSTNKKVMVSDNLPAFLGSSDTIKFSPVIFNKTGKDQDFTVSFDGTNMDLDSKEEKVFIKNWEQKTINFEAQIWQNNILASLSSKINIKAVAQESKDSDEIEKTLEIKNTYTREVVASAWSTASSKNEKLDIKDIINYPGYLSLNYSSTLLTNLTDSVDYLNNYPYWCSEQKTSSLMPNIFIKKLYNSAKIEYNLKEKMIDYYAWTDEGFKKKSLDEIIKNYTVDIAKFQKDSGWFGYWKDLSVWNNFADFALTSYIVDSLSEIRNIWYNIDIASTDSAVKYLKNRFYKNTRENCIVTKYNDCKYWEIERLKAIEAIVNYNNSDYEAYKMYKLIDFTKDTSSSFSLENAKTMASLYAASSKMWIDKNWSEALRRSIKSSAWDIISENLVYSPRWSYISGTDGWNRIENTSNLVYLMSKAGLENFKDSEAIIENILRWMIAQKSDTWFGSTADNISVIKAFTSYLENSGELKDVNITIISELNWKAFDKQNFNKDNKLITLETTKDFKDMKESNDLKISKTGTGKAYYDMSLVYYIPSKEIKARNSGFYLKTKYFDYNEYKKIEILKNEEWSAYLSGTISYDKLKYPNEINTYLKEVEISKVGQLLIVYNKLIVSETRDKVAFEWFIPSGAEIVNPNFATSTAKAKEFANNFFDRTEYRLDRFFAYKWELDVWNYDFIYLIRATHTWTFNLKASQISEFYTPEVFGRTSWREFIVE